MKLNSKLFDKIRIRPDEAALRREQFPPCEWEGCGEAGAYRAPKGRGREGEYHRYCIDHVRLYNKSYNYFSGMADDAVAAYQRDAITGHRPTWTMGVNRWTQGAPQKSASFAEGEPFSHGMSDPFGIFHEAQPRRKATEPEPKRRISVLAQQAFDTLDLEIAATKADIKAQFKLLVKRHHPDANGGDRASEERLRQIIQAYNYLKTAGFC